MNVHNPDKYNPNRIIQAANEKLQQEGDWQGGDLLFQTALLQWSDDARESTTDESLREALATLYMAYAHYLSAAKQYKSTMEAYENATQDVNVRHMGRIWLEYAAYCQERQKYRLAQQVYLRALVGDSDGNPPAVPDEQDCDVLWHAFWEMMKEQNQNHDMTLEELQTAVMSEQADATATADAVRSSTSPDLADEPANKKMKFGSNTDEEKAHVVVSDAVQTQETAVLGLLQQPDMPDDIKGAWMMMDGTGLAQPPEPPLFQVSPPKLSDPSGKDILGVDLALALTQQLLQAERGSLVLQVCRALWVMTAVHEKTAAQRLDKLDADWQQAVAQREAEFSSRRSVAQAAHQQSVEHIIQQERHTLHQSIGQERQKVLQEMAWQSRRLLCAQQVVLQKLQIPTFESGPTVDAVTLEWQAKVCSYLHSAFYLRNRIGGTTHISMLQSQCKKLLKEQEHEQQQRQSSTPPPPQDNDGYNTTNSSMYNSGHGGNTGGGYSNYPPPPPLLPPPPPPTYGQPPPPPPNYGPGYGQPAYGGMMPPQQQPPDMGQQYGGPPPPPPPPHGSYPYYQR